MKLNIELTEASEIIALELKRRFSAEFVVTIIPDPGLGSKIGVRITAIPSPKEEK